MNENESAIARELFAIATVEKTPFVGCPPEGRSLRLAHLPTPTLSSLMLPWRNSDTGMVTNAYCSPRRASGKGVGVYNPQR